MAEDLIRYDLLVQEALRGVVRKVLTDAAREGLSGEHHFYVSFRTEAPGVRMSQRLREKYPEDMTIVLQHQFWDLGVTEHSFEVGLSFSGVPERLLVPFDALSGFFDPSVQFGLKFDLNEDGEPAAEPAEPKQGPRGAASEPAELKPRGFGGVGVGANAGTGSGTNLAPLPSAPRIVPALAGNGPKKDADPAKSDAPAAAGTEAKDGKDAKEGSAEVVSLDAFRKKN